MHRLMKTLFMTVLFSVWTASMISFSETIAYWQMDEESHETKIKDAVGVYDLSDQVFLAPSAAVCLVIPNPDKSIFKFGKPEHNTSALKNSHAARPVYDDIFDMRSVPWTIEGWFRCSAGFEQQSTAEVLAATRHSFSGYKGWDLLMQNGKLRFFAAANDGTSASITTDIRYDDGLWHHLAAQWDPDSGVKGKMRLYVDGLLAKEGPGAGDLGDASVHAKRFALGMQLNSSGTGAQLVWKGELDEFRFSNALIEAKEFLSAGIVVSQDVETVTWDLTAAYRHGQVFIQWKEAPSNLENLRVYMHDEPISSSNFDQAVLVEQRIEPHSANDWYEDPTESPKTDGPVRGWIIQEGPPPLNPVDGLFVHTVTKTTPLAAYFSVLTSSQEASDLMAGVNSMTQAVDVCMEPIQGVWQTEAFIDKDLAKGKPLAIYLHSHQSRPSGTLNYLVFGTREMGWREGLPFKFKVSTFNNIVLVEPYDRVWINRRLDLSETSSQYNRLYKNIETWHYGTNDKIYDRDLRTGGVAVNYTERLHLWILGWVEKIYQTDANRVYAYGASMGTGVQRLVMQNPDRFACVDLLVPFVDWSYENNVWRLEACCGPMTMMTSDGIALSNRMNLVAVVQNAAQDLPHVTIRVGRADSSVYWARKPAYMAAMQANRQGLIAGWDNGSHSTAMRQSIPAFPDFRDYSYAVSRFAINRSYPAFSNFSMNEDPGNGDPLDGDIIGFINRGLEWSDIIDQDDRYEVSIQTTHPDASYPVKVDITLRNRQRFKPRPGSLLCMQNRNRFGDIIEDSEVVTDENGLITIKNFSITSEYGNTLTISARQGTFAVFLTGQRFSEVNTKSEEFK